MTWYDVQIFAHTHYWTKIFEVLVDISSVLHVGVGCGEKQIWRPGRIFVNKWGPGRGNVTEETNEVRSTQYKCLCLLASIW